MIDPVSVDTLKTFFFADRVVKVIERGGKIDKTRQELLERVLEHLTMVQRGESQIRTGHLVERPVESLVAYRKALEVVSILEPKNDDECFKEVLEKVDKEVKSALKSKAISVKRLKTTHVYFKQASNLAIEEISSSSLERQEQAIWQSAMP